LLGKADARDARLRSNGWMRSIRTDRHAQRVVPFGTAWGLRYHFVIVVT